MKLSCDITEYHYKQIRALIKDKQKKGIKYIIVCILSLLLSDDFCEKVINIEDFINKLPDKLHIKKTNRKAVIKPAKAIEKFIYKQLKWEGKRPVQFEHIEAKIIGNEGNGMKVTLDIKIESYDEIFDLCKKKINGGKASLITPAIEAVQETVSKETLDKLLVNYIRNANDDLCEFAGKKIEKMGVDIKLSNLEVIEEGE